MRTQTEEALQVQNATICQLGEENIRLRRGIERIHSACQGRAPKQAIGEMLAALLATLPGASI